MNVETLKAIARARRLNQSDVARLAGVSRQAACLWWHQTGEANVQFKHLRRLATALGVSLDDLAGPLPLLDDEQARAEAETELLWDRIYPDLTSFAGALLAGEPPALARLVQAYGLFGAEKIIGKRVWRDFPGYRNGIPPALRAKYEVVWKTVCNRASN